MAMLNNQRVFKTNKTISNESEETSCAIEMIVYRIPAKQSAYTGRKPKRLVHVLQLTEKHVFFSPNLCYPHIILIIHPAHLTSKNMIDLLNYITEFGWVLLMLLPFIPSGWWYTYPSDQHGVRQLGWWHSIPNSNGKSYSSHVPVTTNQFRSLIIPFSMVYIPCIVP